MRFSEREIRDLLVAWFMISLAFAILFTGFPFSLKVFVVTFVISILTAGIGFLLHELMHKYVAQRYNLWAEFRASYNMLYLAILFSFFGFIIAAPGAVLIQGNVNRERNGRISLAGPATNIVLAVVFLVLLVLVNSESEIINLFFNFGFTINSLLALFNMIPVNPFDGKKIIDWDKRIYYLTVFLAGGMFIGSFFI